MIWFSIYIWLGTVLYFHVNWSEKVVWDKLVFSGLAQQVILSSCASAFVIFYSNQAPWFTTFLRELFLISDCNIFIWFLSPCAGVSFVAVCNWRSKADCVFASSWEARANSSGCSGTKLDQERKKEKEGRRKERRKERKIDLCFTGDLGVFCKLKAVSYWKLTCVFLQPGFWHFTVYIYISVRRNGPPLKAFADVYIWVKTLCFFSRFWKQRPQQHTT